MLEEASSLLREQRPGQALHPAARRAGLTPVIGHTVKARASASSASSPVQAVPVRHFSMVASKPPGASMRSAGPDPRVAYSTSSPSMVALGMAAPWGLYTRKMGRCAPR